MDINDLFDGIMKSINQFAEGHSRTSCASRHSNVPVHQIAEQRLQEKMQDNGLERSEQTVREQQASPEGMPLRCRAHSLRGQEFGGKNVENFTLLHPWLRGLRPALRTFSRRVLRLGVQAKETNLPGRQKFGQPKAGRKATGHRDVACNRDMTSFPKKE